MQLPAVRVVKTPEEVEGLRQWWESWPGNRDSEIDSYMTFLESNPSTVRPHVVVVERGGKPDAILVGRIDRGLIACRLGYLKLNVPAKIMYFVYGALRGNASKEDCDLIVASILESLSHREANVAYMNFLREDSDLYRAAVQKPSVLCRDYLRLTQPHFTTTLPGSPEEFYGGLSSGARWQAKSKQKKLIKDFDGDVRIRCFHEVAELDTMVQDLEQVARKSYQRGLGVGFLDTPTARTQLRLKAERGWLRSYILYLGDRPAAFWMGDVNDGTFGSDYLAFDVDFGKYSPGMFLICRVIEDFCKSTKGVNAIDFATGHAQYKEVLSNQQWSETSAYIFAPTIRGIGLNSIRSLVGGVDQVVKNVLVRTNLLQRVKKAWRASARSKAAAQS